MLINISSWPIVYTCDMALFMRPRFELMIT